MGSRSDDEVMTSPSPEGGDNDVLLAVSPNNRGVDRMVLTVSVTLLPPRGNFGIFSLIKSPRGGGTITIFS